MSLRSLGRYIFRSTVEESGDQHGYEFEKTQGNTRGDLDVAWALPYRAELNRQRRSYVAIASAAAAPVAAMPTTAAQLTLFNGELAHDRSYVIDSVFVVVVASAAASTAVSIVGCINVNTKAAPTTNLLTPRGLAGQRYMGQGVVATGQTITNDLWFSIGNSSVSATSGIGITDDYPLDGMFVLPSRHMFSITAVANTAATITCRLGIRWHEAPVPCLL